MQLSLGTYRLRVRARDGEANVSPWEDVTLRAVDTFQPEDPSDVFAPAEYLKDLLWFFAGPVERMVDADRVPSGRKISTLPTVHQLRVWWRCCAPFSPASINAARG
jgi:hypothetical protein